MILEWSEQQSNGAGGFFVCTTEVEGIKYYVDLSDNEEDKNLLFVRKGVAIDLLGSYDTLEAAKAAAQEHYNKTIK